MIFISHKTDPDHQKALELCRRLEENGLECWIAPEEIECGQAFYDEIPKAIRRSEFVVVLLTEASQESAHVKKEIDIAINYHRHIIPLVIGDFDMSHSVEYLLSGVQFKPFNTEEDLQAILQILKNGVQYLEFQIGGSRTFTRMRGDFQENMEHLICEETEQAEHTLFAMGIDRSGDLGISTQKGIVHWVCKYLLENFGVTLEALQILLNEALREQLGSKPGEMMNYGDCVVLPVRIEVSGMVRMIRLLFVANSEHDRGTGKRDSEQIIGIDSREIILKVFRHVEVYSEQTGIDYDLLIGAMGTNGLNFPYEVVTAEILNCFLHANKIGIRPKKMFYSVRSSDMEKHGITSELISSYISTVLKFFE